MTIERIFLHDLASLVHSAGTGARAHQLRDFEEKEPEPEPPPPPPLTEADIKAAEQEGYRRGFIEGEREGKYNAESQQAKINEELNISLKGFVKYIEQLIENYNAFVHQARTMLPPLALAIARKAAGNALQENALPVIESTVAACVESLLAQAHIQVTVHESQASTLEQRLTALLAHRHDPADITIVGDAAMPITDCRIEWKQGHAVRSGAEIWQQMENLIAGMVSAAEREPPAVCPLSSHT